MWNTMLTMTWLISMSLTKKDYLMKVMEKTASFQSKWKKFVQDKKANSYKKQSIAFSIS